MQKKNYELMLEARRKSDERKENFLYAAASVGTLSSLMLATLFVKPVSYYLVAVPFLVLALTLVLLGKRESAVYNIVMFTMDLLIFLVFQLLSVPVAFVIGGAPRVAKHIRYHWTKWFEKEATRWS